MDYEKGVPRNLVQFSEYPDLAFTDTGIRIDDNSDPNSNVLWTSEKINQLINNTPRVSMPQRAILPPLNQMQNALFNNAVQSWPQQQQRPTNMFGEHHPNIPRIFKPKRWFSRIVRSRDYYCQKCMHYKDYFFTSKYKNNTCIRCNCDACNQNKLQPQQAPMQYPFQQMRMPSITIGPPSIGNVSPNNPIMNIPQNAPMMR